MTSVAMIPVMLVSTEASDGTTKTYAIQDSKAIVQFFEDRHTAAEAPTLHRLILAIPDTPKRGFLAMLLELVADEWLLIQAMYWRWFPPHLDKQRTFLEYEFGELAMGGKGSFTDKVALGKEVWVTVSTSCYVD
jgi:hypothetical protein